MPDNGTVRIAKLCTLMKSNPNVAMNSSGRNLRTVVTIWVTAMVRTPERLIRAGTHRPIKAIRTDQPLAWPLFQNTSTYPTQATAIAALPAHAVIQYDQAVRN